MEKRTDTKKKDGEKDGKVLYKLMNNAYRINQWKT